MFEDGVTKIAKTYGVGSGTRLVVTTGQVYSLARMLDGR